MEAERPSTAHTSGSKRKRSPGDHTPSRRGADSDVDDYSEYDDATPNKRQRANPHQSDVSASEDNQSKQPRSVRRKKGSRNLSNLNLRHAAQTQTPSQATIRRSRFQEGSLTDKPCDKPPSFFTRFSRTDIEAVEHVDTLMSEYHDAALTPPHSAGRGSVTEPAGASGIESSVTKKEEARGFFQFGRQFVANLHPVALWKSVWNEAKEELTREKIEENARKARLKADAEAKYAEMKRTAHFSLPLNSSLASRYQNLSEDVLTPRESAITSNSLHSSVDQNRNTSAATVLRSFAENADQSTSEVPESTGKFSRGFKDRLHLKKPSLSNLKSDLKRMRSDMNLVGTREPSSSVSPIKTDVEGSTLKKAASRADLRKQQKLSKRVSDLENKLQLAREELNDALVEASPMPKLAGKYERFTPSGTIKRPKFMPGKLPSLPSERVLMGQDQVQVNEESEVEPKKAIDLSLKDFLAGQQQVGEEEETIKASRARVYPPRAASLFTFDFDSNTENLTPPEHHEDRAKESQSEQYHTSEAEDNMDSISIGEVTNGTSETTNNISEITNNINEAKNNINETTGMTAPQPPKAAEYATLDAKLKALDANIKTAKKTAQATKKRKTSEKDTAFKPPGADSDDDAEWVQATPKKKRKSGGKTETSPPNKRGTRGGNEKSPSTNKAKTTVATTTVATTEEVKLPEPEHTSTDIETSILDPVIEEEEVITAVPGIDGVPMLPAGPNGKDEFKWPEDVF